MKLKIDKFVLSIIGTILIAYFFPEWGAQESEIPIDTISAIGILLIFFFYGLKLNPTQLKAGLKNWKSHLLVLGLLLQRFLGVFAHKQSSKWTLFDKSIILLIIYKSFAESFNDNIFSAVSLLDLAAIFIGVIVLFGIAFLLTGFISKKLKLNTEDQITAQFCGTKKSLVHGTVFSKILFGNMASVGIILLPLMLFHTTQILIISIVTSKKSRAQVLES